MSDIAHRIAILPITQFQKETLTRAATYVSEHVSDFRSALKWLDENFGAKKWQSDYEVKGSGLDSLRKRPRREKIKHIAYALNGFRDAARCIALDNFPAGKGAVAHSRKVLLVAFITTCPVQCKALGEAGMWEWDGEMFGIVFRPPTVGREAILFDRPNRNLRIDQLVESWFDEFLKRVDHACDVLIPKPIAKVDADQLPAAHFTVKYGIPAGRLDKARRDNRLPGTKIGGRWRYRESDVRFHWPEDFT